MLPLNDDWLSWPPESLESFHEDSGDPEDETAVYIQENNNDSVQTDINH